MNVTGSRKEVRVALAGAGGRMGRALGRCLQTGAVPGLRWTGALERPGHPLLGHDAGCEGSAGFAVSDDFAEAVREADVLVDFSAPEAAASHADAAAARKLALVLGTTGLDEAQQQAVERASASVPVVQAANMSLGINLLLDLVRRASAALAERGYDIEIVERHHRRKKDAPSGTALALGRAAAEGRGWSLEEVAVHGRAGLAGGDRPDRQIGFHALRAGDIVGDHAVLFAAEGEGIELAHRATTRDTFALGALRAAAWVAGRSPGLYAMRDVLGLEG